MKKTFFIILTALILGLFTGGYQLPTIQNKQVEQQASSVIAPHYYRYSDSQLQSTLRKDGKAVLFFAADWCGTCTILDDQLMSRNTELPSNLTVFKVNFDIEKTLKNKYAVVVQHTLVEVDRSGNVMKKWVGGDFDEFMKELL